MQRSHTSRNSISESQLSVKWQGQRHDDISHLLGPSCVNDYQLLQKRDDTHIGSGNGPTFSTIELPDPLCEVKQADS